MRCPRCVRYSLVLMRYWLVKPGWSTSWMAAEKTAAITSNGVNTACKEDQDSFEDAIFFLSPRVESCSERERDFVCRGILRKAITFSAKDKEEETIEEGFLLFL